MTDRLNRLSIGLLILILVITTFVPYISFSETVIPEQVLAKYQSYLDQGNNAFVLRRKDSLNLAYQYRVVSISKDWKYGLCKDSNGSYYTGYIADDRGSLSVLISTYSDTGALTKEDISYPVSANINIYYDYGGAVEYYGNIYKYSDGYGGNWTEGNVKTFDELKTNDYEFVLTNKDIVDVYYGLIFSAVVDVEVPNTPTTLPALIIDSFRSKCSTNKHYMTKFNYQKFGAYYTEYFEVDMSINGGSDFQYEYITKDNIKYLVIHDFYSMLDYTGHQRPASDFYKLDPWNSAGDKIEYRIPIAETDTDIPSSEDDEEVISRVKEETLYGTRHGVKLSNNQLNYITGDVLTFGAGGQSVDMYESEFIVYYDSEQPVSVDDFILNGDISTVDNSFYTKFENGLYTGGIKLEVMVRQLAPTEVSIILHDHSINYSFQIPPDGTNVNPGDYTDIDYGGGPITEGNVFDRINGAIDSFTQMVDRAVGLVEPNGSVFALIGSFQSAIHPSVWSVVIVALILFVIVKVVS